MNRIIPFVIICALLNISAYADGTHPQGIRLDGTVGTAGKIELPGPNYAIKPEYGKQSGSNLFHSFQQFNIHNGESATFSGPASVQNIISRVTGGSASWIDGRLASTIPGADLYFLNPAGVMFGSNAALDLSGSFHVSTADYLRMGENERFYSKPIENEVLSVAPPSAFGFLSDKPGKISLDGAKLQVTEEKNILLIGGDIEISNGRLAPGGQVGIFGIGNISLSDISVIEVPSGKGLLLIGGDIKISTSMLYAPGGQIAINGKGNVSLSDASLIDIMGIGGGSVVIRGGHFVAKNSIIRADTSGEKDGGAVDIQADSISFRDSACISSNSYDKGNGGDVRLKATESVSFAGENSKIGVSRIEIRTFGKEVSAGDAGNLTIEAKNIVFADGAIINAITTGKGNGGDVTLKASESISFSGENSQIYFSGIGLGTGDKEEGAGDSGNILLEAKNIAFTGGAVISSSTTGKGKGGEITLKATESVSFSGENSKANYSQLALGSIDKEEGAGDAGKLLIEAKNITFTDGAHIISSTTGKGKGGDVTLKATESVSFSGENSEASVSRIAIGTEYTEKGAGNAGKLIIEAKDIAFTDGALINANTEGKGKGGDVMLKATESVSFSGENSSKINSSSIGTATIDNEEGAGYAGELTIEAKNIAFTDGAYITSSTLGKGKGGEITLKASESVSFSGENSHSTSSRIYLSSTDTGESAGDSGKLLIEATNIAFTKGALIDSTTFSKGKGGDVTLKASESVLVAGENSKAVASGIEVMSKYTGEGAGDAGELTIEAKNIVFTGGTYIGSSTLGKGKAGDITLTAAESVLVTGENSKAEVTRIETGTTDKEEGAGDAGKLTIDAENIVFADGALINSTTYGKGNGGEVTLKAAQAILFIGENRKGDFITDIQIAAMGDGDAGKLTIGAKNIFFTDGAYINLGTYGKGTSGEVILNAADIIALSGFSSKGIPSFVLAGSNSDSENAGAGGKISVSAKKLQISDRGGITTSSEGGGQAGDISLNVGNLELRGGASVASDATLSGGGRITVNAKDTVYLSDSSITTNVSSGIEKGGDITIGNPDTGAGSRFVIMNHSRIQADAKGEGDGGAVFIQTENFLKSADSKVTATSARGNQGTVEIEAPDLDLSGALMFLPGSILDVTQFAPTPCAARSARTFSTFVITGPDAVPTPADDLQSAPLSATGSNAVESEDTTSLRD